MRIRRLLGAGLAAIVAVGVAPAAASAATRTAAPRLTAVRSASAPVAVAAPAPAADARVIATFPRGSDGSFAESAVVDRAGDLYVALTTWTDSGWNRGQIWKVTPSGHRTRYGPEFAVGVLTGLALDAHGRLYAGLAAWTDPKLPVLRSGVLRIDARSATRVLTLPTAAAETSSFPNGLAFHDGDLYVSDSLTGAVWRTHPRGAVDDVQRTPWLTSAVLAPTAKGGLGINGIAFRGDRLYGVVADSGVLVEVGLGRHGRPSPVRVVTRSTALVHADGVTFDAAGRLWATTNGGAAPKAGSLVRVERSGGVTVVLATAPWLDYPTQLVFGTTRHTAGTLYVTNGAFNSTGNSTVVALRRSPVRR